MDSSITRGLYRDITEFAHGTPEWVHLLAQVWTEAGLLIFGALFVVGWWQGRTRDARFIAVAVLAPLATAAGYLFSETFKSVVDEERPCRTVTEAAPSIVTCPPTGDWSFPSNHSAIAGAAALALVLVWPRIWLLTVPMAVLMAFSRVFVGVHYPHDVAVGLVVGALVAWVFVLLLRRPAERLLTTMRTSRNGLVLWFAGPGPLTEAGPVPPQSPAPGRHRAHRG
ncbi:phosphatase PAP2 family protein [Streptomyces sp. NPDC005805]|uniref:phosphatase PAP2 family protein n=1 Tax=Streptomyces sp. NPDC005805 TaxID=3157068 RepID=UPI0033D022B4